MKRPLGAVVVAYGAGLLPAYFFQPPLAALLLLDVLLAGLLGGLIFFGVKRFRAPVVWLLLALAGWTNFTWRTAVSRETDLRVVMGTGVPAAITVSGTLVEPPRLKIIEDNGVEKWHSLAKVKVSEITDNKGTCPATGEISVSTPGVLGADFFSGQRVVVAGVISIPPPPLAEGLFDFGDYLAVRGMYYQFRADSTNDWRVREPRVLRPPLTDRFLTWSQATLSRGLPANDETVRLLWAMTLGWRTAFTGDVGDPFLRAGTMHLFAVDGLRIALLSGILITLLRPLRLVRSKCGIIAIAMMWFYTAATGWESSAIRASVMMSLVIGGWALERPYDLLNALAAAALVILVANPCQVLEAGFQLSFLVMLAISLMLKPTNAWLDGVVNRWLGPDPLLPLELVPAWRKKLLEYARTFAHGCGLSFIAWLGSLPLAAEYFHLFSPVSTLANIPAIPLGALALAANLGALACGDWLPWGTEIFNHAAWSCMWAMTWVSEFFAKLPGAYFYVPAPPVAAIAVYYAVLAAAFSGWFNTRRRRLAGVALLALIAAGCLGLWLRSRSETDLTVLPLRGGHAVYVDADGRQNDWLINCGSRDAVQWTLKDYLRGQGVNPLPRLVLANANARNCGGTPQLMELFPVGELWTSGVNFRSLEYRRAVASFELKVSSGGSPRAARHRQMNCGETIGCWRVLHPAATGGTAKVDDAPLVLLGNFNGTRILLLGELSRDAQSELLGRTNDLRADIVVAGLPDNSQPLCDHLIAAIQPRVMIIADSEWPPARRASQALQQRLAQTQIPVIYTRTSRAVKIATTPAGWKLTAMDGTVFSSGAGPASPTRNEPRE